MNIQNFLSSFRLGAASGWDIFIIIIFLIAIFVYGFLLGKNRMIILLLSSYFSLAIIQLLPWQRLTKLKWLGIEQNPSASLKIFIFLGIVLLLYFLIPRSILSSTLKIKKRGEAGWTQLFILGIFQIGLLAMIILSFLPIEVAADFSALVKKIFIGQDAQFVWITLPILAVVLMRKKKKFEE